MAISLDGGVNEAQTQSNEKDELIAALRKRLGEFEERCRNLELALNLLTSGKLEELLGNAALARSQPAAGDSSAAGLEHAANPSVPGAVAIEPPLYDDTFDDVAFPRESPEPPPAPIVVASSQYGESSLDALVLTQTAGLYPDHWLNAVASLAINKSHGGRTIAFNFYLPEAAGAVTKTMRLKPNYADPVNLELKRGQTTIFTSMVPDLQNFTPRLNIDVDPEPRQGSDKRQLGAVLVSVGVAA